MSTESKTGGTPEADSKAVAKRLLQHYDFFEGEMPGLKEGLEKVRELSVQLEGVDLKSIGEEVDRTKTAVDEVTKLVRTRASSFNIPGLEDEGEAKKFSLVRASYAINSGNWAKAGFEKEVLTQARERIKNVMGVDSEGGFFVPDQVIADVIGKIYANSTLISLNGDGETRIRVLPGLFGGSVRVPRFEGGVVAYWIGEDDKYVESKVAVGDMKMEPHKLTLVTRITEELARFSSYGFEQLVRADMAKSAALKLDWTAFYGTGNESMPRGLVSTPGVLTYSAEANQILTAPPADAEGGEFDFDSMDEFRGALEDNNAGLGDDYTSIMPSRLLRRMRRIRVPQFSGDTGGTYLLGAPMMTDGQMTSIIGEFTTSNRLGTKNRPGESLGWPTTSTDKKFGDVFGGNWSEMIFGQWGALELISDEGKGPGFLRDRTYLKARMFGDFGIRRPEQFVICPDARLRD